MDYPHGLIARYKHRLDISPSAPAISLHEGATPLIPAPRLAEWAAPGAQLFLKYEGLNPTGSFKDRGMTTAITEAVHQGAKAVICASTGNTAASAAAYAARAGVACYVIIPACKVAVGKLAGAIAFGAKVIQIDGNFDEGLKLVQKLGEVGSVAVVNSVNPARLEGQKTAAWELCEELGRSPDWLALPVGNAGNISAYWLGFGQCQNCECAQKPRLLGVQAEGAAPLVKGHVIDHPETKATAIRIGNPARGEQALRAIKESEGLLLAVSDAQIFEAYREVARREGVFCEPSSATGIAGLKVVVENGDLDPIGKTIVCVLTGNGLKDPDSAIDNEIKIVTIPPTLEELQQVIG